MYKIEIEWGFRSPTLRILTGEVRLGRIDMGRLDKEEIESFPVKKEQGSRGYKNCPAIFNSFKPLVDLMVDSYYDGMIMKEESFAWVRNGSRHNNDVHIILAD
jgi:hypothetical protein